MTYIDEETEHLIDTLKDDMLKLDRGNTTFSISGRQIYCYGEVDFNNKEDLDTIDKFKFLDHLGAVGIPFRSRYNYETHSCTSPYKRTLWTETWSPATLARFAHASLGKPKRIILFSQG